MTETTPETSKSEKAGATDDPTVEAAKKHLAEYVRLLEGLPADVRYPQYALAVLDLRRLWKIAIGFPKMNEYEAQARIDKGGKKP